MSIDQKILEQFEAVVESQRKRIADMKAQDDFIDYSKLDKLIIGVCGGDGIGPMITGMAQHALETLLADKVKAGKVEFRVIDGLTIERRARRSICLPTCARSRYLSSVLTGRSIVRIPKAATLSAHRACRSMTTCSSTLPLRPRRAVSVSRVWRLTMRKRPARTASPA